MVLQLRLLGGFEAQVSGTPVVCGRLGVRVLALLALRQGRETERAWLAATLWPDAEESRSRFYLRRTLSELREALGESALLVAEGSRLRLEAQTDLQAFEQALQRQDTATANALYRGPLLEGWHDDWALVERNRCEQALLAALESQADIPCLRRALTLDPLRESVVRALMQALAARGDAAAAQQEFRALRQRLAQQCLGEPDPQTVALARQLKPSADQPAAKLRLADPPRPLPLPLTPLRGRDEDLTLLLGLLRSHRLVTLTGAGGIGKTRLAQEVALESEARFPAGAVFVDLSAQQPGGALGDVLAQALGLRSLEVALHYLQDKYLLLVFDNCEQLMSECAQVVRALLTRTRQVHVLATSREPLHLPGESVWRVPSLAGTVAGGGGGGGPLSGARARYPALLATHGARAGGDPHGLPPLGGDSPRLGAGRAVARCPSCGRAGAPLGGQFLTTARGVAFRSPASPYFGGRYSLGNGSSCTGGADALGAALGFLGRLEPPRC